jgi:hypothetical protein
VPITLDRSQFPLVIVRFRGEFAENEFETYLEQLHEVYAQKKRFALILDSIGGAAPTAKQRKLQADWIRERADLIREYNVGTAFVLDSVLLRGSLTAILWLQPLPCPHLVCAEISEAISWATTRLAALR